LILSRLALLESTAISAIAWERRVCIGCCEEGNELRRDGERRGEKGRKRLEDEGRAVTPPSGK
jgi:hypothetical protein